MTPQVKNKRHIILPLHYANELKKSSDAYFRKRVEELETALQKPCLVCDEKVLKFFKDDICSEYCEEVKEVKRQRNILVELKERSGFNYFCCRSKLHMCPSHFDLLIKNMQSDKDDLIEKATKLKLDIESLEKILSVNENTLKWFRASLIITIVTALIVLGNIK